MWNTLFFFILCLKFCIFFSDFSADLWYNKIIREGRKPHKKTAERKLKMARIFRLSDKAIENEMDWDTAISENEIETVKEFETYSDAVTAFENGNYDTEVFGVE